ncbi:MAG TPA: hypothetical protein VJA25_06205 [Dehalococcoidia bacterium]|nr:hypothetical protein [Dehalococcoidia bacterium]
MIPKNVSRASAVVLAVAAVVGLVAVTGPSTTSARPFYAAETLQTCGVCHVSPSGGGPRNPLGQAFEAIPTHFTDPAGAWEQVAPGPTLRMLSPTAGQIISDSTLTVTVRVTNFTLAPKAIGGPNQPGQGHWQLVLDGALVSFVGTDSFTLAGLTRGPHQIRVALHNNDHSLLSPPLEAWVSFGRAMMTTRANLPQLLKDAGL